MKKILSLLLSATMLISTAAPAAPLEKAASEQQISRVEALQQLEKAKAALKSLEADLDLALHGEKTTTGKVALAVRNGAGIVAALGVSFIAIYFFKSTISKAPGNSASYGWGSKALFGLLTSIVSLVVAATSQGVIYLTEVDAQKAQEKIKKCRQMISDIEAKLAAMPQEEK